MFETVPTYDRYRTLRRTAPMMRGEDVYALQTGLHALGYNPGTADGILGDQTAAAIRAAQSGLGVTVDGLAGGGTQTAIAKKAADRARVLYSLPVGLAFGQIMHESSCRLGNYSPARSDGTYDAGVAQRNTKLTPAKNGFDVPTSVDALGARARQYFNKFAGLPLKRRWELAAGAWNAPAYACWIAKNEGATKVATAETAKPSEASRAKLEEYMQSVTAFMVL